MIEKTIVDIDNLMHALNELPNPFIYRGQASANWGLTSALERVIGDDWSKKAALKFEEFSLRQFKSKFHLYDRENISPDTKLSWLAAMQHYGIPTRLVDFTESPYVALYFALETYCPNAHGDFAVFAINYSELMDRSLQIVSDHDNEFDETRQTIQDKQDQVFEEVIERYSHPIAWTTEPQILNTRLDRQAGSFLLSVDKGTKISNVLNSATYEGVTMFKFIISKDLYVSVFALLRKMNLTSKSLYGDLDGLAKSIRMEMLAYASD